MKPDLIIIKDSDTVTIADKHGTRSITEDQLQAKQGFKWSTSGTVFHQRPSIVPEICVILILTITIVFNIVTLIQKLKS